MSNIPDRAAFEQRITEAWRQGGNSIISMSMRQYDNIMSMLKMLPDNDKKKIMSEYTTHVDELITALTVNVTPIIEKQLEAARSKIR